ncbi:hypothetical protein B7C51_25040 (plasmid) [Paenibacillus larvae subsp. pulvifaciens]|uniref:Uncharacterized protein n=1 Tax=Paenibacillus larvae subsp. pulvifaciens TaxID=1477 RepID=A0A1V0V063_9BACL|nr:hypothetical protein [Paenibacillus larvae]ARF70741.1 hypothetical protein B7C51_25040 [Paenibacillus larvae subsp. pulvifaciens]
MNTVVLYMWENLQAVEGWHTRKGFSFEFEGNYGFVECDGGKEYILPEGYEVTYSQGGELSIFDSEGKPCLIEYHKGWPLLRSTHNGGGVVLKEAV